MIKKFLHVLPLFFILFFGLSQDSKASHLMGGEITWECTGSGQYIIRFSVYRDCSGATISPEQSGDLILHNYPNFGDRRNLTQGSTAGVNEIAANWGNSGADSEIAPECRGGSPINCNSGVFRGLAVFEYLRETDPITLAGIPPAEGWIITYDDNARNSTDNLPSSGITLRAKILPHSGSLAGQCVDNSPKFREKPTSLICNNQNFTYNHNATDVELDSIVYEWGKPLSQVGDAQNNVFREGIYPIALIFTNGYSFNNPFPGPELLDPNTGEITLSPNAGGKYVSVIKVSAYKCGEKVA